MRLHAMNDDGKAVEGDTAAGLNASSNDVRRDPVARDPEPRRGDRRVRWPSPSGAWLRRLPLAVVAALVMVVGLEPVPIPEWFPQQDKLHHLLGFAALCFTARLAFPRVRSGWLVAACLLAALLIEACQGLFLPARTASLGDMAANALGVMLGVAAARWIRAG